MSSETSKRYAFVDALRGLAALWVVTFHAYAKNLVPMTGYSLPEPFDSLFAHGNMGVYIFFVISGFVIMQSIRGAHITPGFVGRFALRRSIRLDPPYWVTIVAMIVLSYVSGRAQTDHAALPLPTVKAIFAHLFYAQWFLGYPHIVGVFWTLCYEVQFYLTLVLLFGVSQWKRELLRSRWVLFAPLWIACALAITGVIEPTPALFVYGWPYFFLGVVVNWVHNRETPSWLLGATAAATLLLVPWATTNPEMAGVVATWLKVAVALTTATAIYLVSLQGKLATMTLGRAVQYLGRISYSLYLVHMLVGTPLVRFGLRHLGTMNFSHAWILMIGCCAVSIGAAHLLYVLVERPAVKWSHKLVNLKG